MADVFNQEKRSEVMSKIRSKDTQPELVVRKYLHALGFRFRFRFRLHTKGLPGKPDLVLHKYKTVIFIHGCFWHGHTDKKCNVTRIPKSNTQFWIDKFEYNKSRHKKCE